LRSAGIETTCLGINRRRPLRAIARLAKALRASRPELVQSFLFHANVATRLAAPWAGRPWVVGGLRVAEREKEWHCCSMPSPRAGRRARLRVERVWRHSRFVGRLPAERLAIIPNGIDPTPIDRAEPVLRAAIGVPDEAHLALFVGRLERQKGLPHLFDAASRVIASHPNWHLALAGEGPGTAGLNGPSPSRPPWLAGSTRSAVARMCRAC